MPITRSCTKCGRNFVEYEETDHCPICDNPFQKSVFLNDKTEGETMAKHSKRNRRNRKNKAQKAAEKENKTQVPITTPANPPATTPVTTKTTTFGRANSWEVELDTVNACGKAPKEIIVWFEPIVKSKIDALMDEYKSIEWLAYLVGKLDMNDLDNVIVEDLAIPNQEITATSVDNIHMENFNEMGIIGVIHSHHGMGNNFSGTDNDWINQNHKISLCVATSGIKGHLRWKTPCGALMTIEAKCKLRYNVDFNKEEFIKGAKDKIKKKSYTYQPPAQGGYYGAEGYYGGGGYYSGRGGWDRGGNWNRNRNQSSYVGSGSIKEAATKKDEKNFPVDESKGKKLDDSDHWTADAETKELNSDDAPTMEDIKEEETLVQALTEYEKQVVEAGI